MEAFGIVEKLEQYATDKGWLFFNGDNFYVNIDADGTLDGGVDYTTAIQPGQIVLRIELNATPTYSIGNRLNVINYSGLIALGMHLDLDETEANLDESFNQKYNRRLKTLLQTLSNSISEVSCQNNLQITAANIIYDINKFDTNIDFVAGQFTIEQSNFDFTV